MSGPVLSILFMISHLKLTKTHEVPNAVLFVLLDRASRHRKGKCFVPSHDHMDLTLELHWNICRFCKCHMLWHTSVPLQTSGFAQNCSTFYLTGSYWLFKTQCRNLSWYPNFPKKSQMLHLLCSYMYPLHIKILSLLVNLFPAGLQALLWAMSGLLNKASQSFTAQLQGASFIQTTEWYKWRLL